MQTVLNSATWAKQDGPWGGSYQYNLDGYSAPEGDAKVLPDALLSSATVYSSARLRSQVEETEESIETALMEDAEPY